jgi:hypothetical protein
MKDLAASCEFDHKDESEIYLDVVADPDMEFK